MRHEMPLQRADRAYGEILQEVRVAQTGVQILFAFLLTLAFTARFKSITRCSATFTSWRSRCPLPPPRC
jgi:uncharacterized protein DUF6328